MVLKERRNNMAGDTDIKKDGEGAPPVTTVSKEEYDKAMADNEKLKADLEDVRMEVLSPEYMAWLQSGKDKPKDEPKKEELKDEDYEKLSKKELLELAEKRATERIMREAPSKFKEEFEARDKAAVAKELTAFSRTHNDFETFRPIMYGLSLDPKNADLNLQELYDAAKVHVTRIHSGTSESEKDRARKASNEKPGGSSKSYDKDEYKGKSTLEIGKETLDEMKSEFGPIPNA